MHKLGRQELPNVFIKTVVKNKVWYGFHNQTEWQRETRMSFREKPLERQLLFVYAIHDLATYLDTSV